MDLNPYMMLAAVLGIGLILLTVALTGDRRRPRLTDAAAVRDAVDRAEEDIAPDDVLADRDGRTALAWEERGRRLALVMALGARTTVRLVGAGDIRDVAVEGGALRIRIDGYPGGRFVVRTSADGPTIGAWRDRLLRFAATARAA